MHLYGELYFGAGKGFKNIILIAIGTDLGSGIVVDGHVLYGANDSVGEIGHMNMYRELVVVVVVGAWVGTFLQLE